MKLYGDLSNITEKDFQELLTFFYPECNKVSIYFPNDGTDDMMAFKERFLEAIELCEIEDETSVLEPKEGFSMVIAALTTPVQALLQQISPSFHLSFGMMHDDDLTLFISEEGDISIDSENEHLETAGLFSTFKSC